jgi:hypothetical protein
METLNLFGLGAYWAFGLAYYAVWVVSLWTVFQKADQPGWAAIIPFYNLYVLLKTAGRHGWWLILYFVPLVNIIVHLIVSIDLAKSFDRGTLYGFGLWLLPIVFLPILGFGSARYVGPGGYHHRLITV